MSAPDVSIREVDGQPTIRGATTGVGAFVGTCPKGPADKVIGVLSYKDFVLQCGTDGGDLDRSIKAFFDNGGSYCYVVRVLNSDASALKATAALGDMTVTTLYEGDFGNSISANTTGYTVMLASGQTITASSDSVTLVDASNISIGDQINFYDTGAWVKVVVSFVSGSVIYFQTPASVTTIDDTTVGVCSTKHSVTTKVVGTLAASAAVTTIALESIGNIQVGDYVEVLTSDLAPGTGNSFHEGRIVTAINGKNITLSASITPSVDWVTPYVVTMGFDVQLSQYGALLETIPNLSTQGATPKSTRYFKDIVGDSQNISKEVVLTGTAATGDNIPFNELTPYEGASVTLTGGSNGTAAASSDYIGSTVLPLSGLGLFEEVSGFSMLSCPGITTESVLKAYALYCSDVRKTITFLYHAPAEKNYQEAIQWSKFDINLDNTHAVMYYPYYGVADGNGGVINIPAVGAMQGVWARSVAQSGISAAPANLIINNALSLEYTIGSTAHGMLNDAHINTIIEKPGRGIRIMGARVMTTKTDGRQYANVRALLNFVSESLYDNLQWALFKLNDPRLFDVVTASGEQFLSRLWSQGQLYPSNDEGTAYSFLCNADTTTLDDIKNGVLNVVVGIGAPLPVEFLKIAIGVTTGGLSVTEIV